MDLSVNRRRLLTVTGGITLGISTNKPSRGAPAARKADADAGAPA